MPSVEQLPNFPYYPAHISFQLNSHGLQANIKTKRLYMSSYNDNIFENCVALYGDEKLTKYVADGKLKSSQEVKSLMYEKGAQYFLRGEPFGLFSIFNKRNHVFMGQVGVTPLEEPDTVEIGWILHSEFHHQGFAFEASQALIIDYVKEVNSRDFNGKKFPIRKIVATMHPQNIASKKLAEKLGMTFEKEEERFKGLPRLWYSLVV